jgi:hypothetical protein
MRCTQLFCCGENGRLAQSFSAIRTGFLAEFIIARKHALGFGINADSAVGMIQPAMFDQNISNFAADLNAAAVVGVNHVSAMNRVARHRTFRHGINGRVAFEKLIA